MARPRNPETDEVIRMLGTKMSVRSVAAQLGLEESVVKSAYYKHYDEVMALQKAAPLPEGATELSAAEKDTAAVAEPVPEAEPMPEPEPVPEPEPMRDAQGWLDEATRKAAGELGKRTQSKARGLPGAAAPAPRRMKVAGYVGQGGRTYMLRDGGVQILGMTRTDYTTQEIRELADDLIELLGILDGEVIGA